MIRGINIRLLLKLEITVILSYVLVKFMIRPFASDSWFRLAEVFVFSWPNFCEGIVGTIMILLILLAIKGFLLMKGTRIAFLEKYRIHLSVLIAGVYVILQEMKFHNLGGKNVYDPYDVLFSVIGLLTAYFLITKIQPDIRLDQHPGEGRFPQIRLFEAN